MRLLYSILYGLGFVFLSPAFVYKMWKRGKYRENFLQRFGRYSPELRVQLAGKTVPRCWIQAVSVGEMNLALVLIPALRRRLPGHEIIVSTTTSTGYALGQARLPAEVILLYFPQDFRFCVRRAYHLIRPDCMILMESEIWPNHVWEGARRKVPMCLVNARMSPRSAKRHQKMGWLFRSIFSKLSLVCAQSENDSANFRQFGVAEGRVRMTGNLKYDAALSPVGAPPVDPRQVLKELGIAPDCPIVVAGSTHPGEEAILFEALPELRRTIPNLFLILVPRHVERTAEIVELAKTKGVKLALRKNGTATAGRPECLLVNTTGELRWFYNVASVIFVGKSLTGVGGQNIVEAAASGHPVVFGPNMQNFKAIAAEFVAAEAGVQVADVPALRREMEDLLRNEERRGQIVAAAHRVITANLGATERTVELIAKSLEA